MLERGLPDRGSPNHGLIALELCREDWCVSTFLKEPNCCRLSVFCLIQKSSTYSTPFKVRMMKLSIPALWVAALFQAILTFSQATTCNTAAATLDPNCCVKDSGVTAFPNCNYMNSVISSCAASTVSAGPEYISCFCNQALFNAIYG